PTIPPSPDYTPASPDYSPASKAESDPSEDPASGHIPPLPAISPFLSTNEDTTDSNTLDTPPSPTHDTPFTEITASTQRSHVIPHRRVMILAPGQPIPHGRPYRYHPNGPVHMMTARKKVRPLPVHPLSVRHSVNYSSSDSSSRHSSSDHSSPDLSSTSAGPSRKRRRSPMTYVPALPLVSGALSPLRADLIPPPKKVRDISYLADIEVDPRETSDERVTHPAMPKDIPEPTQEGAAKVTYETLGIWFRGFMITHRLSQSIVKELVARRVAEEMEAREAARNLETLNENEEEQEGENGGNENGGNRGNGNGGNGENRNHGMNYEGFMPMARECTFQDFLKYKPHTFSGTEGVNSALTWWNSYKRTIGVDAAYAMKWAELMKLMTEVYCPRNEVQNIETELWNLTVKGNDLTAYTQRFQELILLCTRMVPDEEDIVERFIGGLPDNIQGNVIAANPARLQDTIRIANQLMDKKLHGYAARNAENKRRIESNPRDSRGQQPPFKRKDCPKLRNQNHRNQTTNRIGNKTGGNEVTAKAYDIGGGGTNPDSNVVTGTFLLNNFYASMLFDSGADRSFVSTTFSALLDVAPSTLDTSYAIELTDGRISETNIILKGCTLGLLGNPFNIDLMPI
nr:reverse transcriptase domain-containing protein [Tanacetum cinerariifolium]